MGAARLEKGLRLGLGRSNRKTNKDPPGTSGDSSTFGSIYEWMGHCGTLHLRMSDPALTIANLLQTPALQEACSLWLKSGRYSLVNLAGSEDPVAALKGSHEGIDGVLLEQGAFRPEVYQELRAQDLLLPAVVIGEVTGKTEYHGAEVHLPPDQLEQLPYSLDAAISRFLKSGGLDGGDLTDHVRNRAEAETSTQERWKLANRLKDRLGYLGVYYKRDPERFFRSLSDSEKEDLLRSLSRTYRDLLVSYFRDPAAANQALESFVNTAFFADLPITTTVEIHMNLIDGFWKQLKLEGHKNDFLQDYRLALLDVMAHLCEMYRRAIPPDRPMATSADPLNQFHEHA